MQPFVGELLLGGIRLRDLVGLFMDVPTGHDAYWQGHFLVDRSNLSYFELGRPYMLLLNDGRSCRVMVTKFEIAEQDSMRVDFQPAA